MKITILVICQLLLLVSYCSQTHILFKSRQRGAVLIDNLEIDNFNEINSDTSENIALDFEFKLSLNAYLKNLVASPVRTLAEVIAYNKKHPKEVSIRSL